MTSPETIFALATPQGRSGVAVVRLSGPSAGAVLQKITDGRLPPGRKAVLRSVRDPETGEVLDSALILWFPAPGSFTGEDVAELHLHGGRAVIAAVMQVLSRQPGLRLAEPGEFTRRAFLAGKMDLTSVEGLADLIDAETEVQRRQALRQMGGALSALYEGWRARLLRVLAHAEAIIDFPDEDLPEETNAHLRAGVMALLEEIDAHLADSRRGERLREGIRVAIIGPANAGKSSLLNWLAGRDAAIVSATAGTTRDVIEVHLDLGGYPVLLADTAGLRETVDALEEEGIRRARRWAQDADYRILLLDGAAYDERQAAEFTSQENPSLVAVNKSDLMMSWPTSATAVGETLSVSVKSGQGMANFLARLELEVAHLAAPGEAPALTRIRHRMALESARESLMRFLQAPSPDLAAEDLRLAVREIGRITGRVDVEDLLDVIFRDFCLGK
ncbi:tRNA uridine-5-carboxymethylaminomethyl(34) synthesis GTPase MnmE [Oceanibaculum sp.]|uniref:tRNA uridine-5-carboxymethylaminomethyl(34) synthesis GTPase MnmE n=1 Tax=Oceanibaculum sp. TaxID=1903597 RepID=UPI0025860934|nr:tRNA uridine-5-carboxymethylaminomethyl(34) synthesis GTPase MnmE [Oceanibaculum sp.]MCH2393513.1 tRNA uridine-5-carboxymethylaminomethyl(34) synthesis GTPase MnmE [Oceanibaculum sp.]